MKKLAHQTTEAVVSAFQQKKTSEGWGEIYRRYDDRVVRFCLKMGLNREDALDKAQDIMLKVYGQIHTLKNPNSFEPWLFRIAHNACINHLKYQRKHSKEPLGHLDLTVPVDTWESLLDKEMVAQKKRSRMTAIIAELPPDIKRMVQLKYLDNYSVKSLEKIFDLKESAIKMRLLRAKRKMRMAYHHRPAMAG